MSVKAEWIYEYKVLKTVLDTKKDLLWTFTSAIIIVASVAIIVLLLSKIELLQNYI